MKRLFYPSFYSLALSTALVLTSLALLSCGKSDEQKAKDAIESANIYLSEKDCDQALEILGSVINQGKNAKYLQALSSAYACKSDYTTANFYGTNLPKLDGSLEGLFGSITKFNTSPMTGPFDVKYTSLFQAINVLLYAGNISQSSASNRSAIFSTVEVNDIHVQLIYMLLTGIGKYFFYYGNANPTDGVKGEGSESNGNPNKLTNGCFYSYDPSDADLAAAITALRTANALGTCTAAATGHVKLPALPDEETVTRMCQGVVLFNNFLDVLTNTTIPESGLDLKELGDVFISVCSDVSGLSDLCEVKDLAECKADYSSSPQTDKLQMFIFYIFETLFR